MISWSCAECGWYGKANTVYAAMVSHEAVSPKCSVVEKERINIRPDQSIVFERQHALERRL